MGAAGLWYVAPREALADATGETKIHSSTTKGFPVAWVGGDRGAVVSDFCVFLSLGSPLKSEHFECTNQVQKRLLTIPITGEKNPVFAHPSSCPITLFGGLYTENGVRSLNN